MAKRDYKNATLRATYRSKAPKNSDTKVSVVSADKRDRGELLDTLEDLFQGKEGGGTSITPEKLRAFLTMLVLSVNNSSDDSGTPFDITKAANAHNITTSTRGAVGTIYQDRNGFIKAKS